MTATPTHVGRIETAERTGHHLGHRGLIDAEQGRLVAIDLQHPTPCRMHAAIVDIDDIDCRIELLAHARYQRLALLAASGINFGDDGRLHRRTGRHFDDLHRSAVA